MKRSLKKHLQGSEPHTLAQFRVEFGMTQAQLALFLGVSRSYVCLMENGIRVMPTEIIMKIEAHREQVKDTMALKADAYEEKARAVPPVVIEKLRLRLATVRNKEFRLRNLIQDIAAKTELALKAHTRLNIVHTEDSEPRNKIVFQVSQLKIRDHIISMPARDLKHKIKLDLLQAEAQIVQKYLTELENHK